MISLDFRTLSRFGLKKMSQALRDVIASINNLLEQEGGENEFSSLITAIQSEEIEKRYREQHGIKYSKAYPIIVRLLGKKTFCREDTPPKADHISLFIKDGKPYSYTSQPYNGLSYEEIKEQIEFCEKNGYELRICPSSWHYPNWTILLEYKKRR